MWSQDFLLIVSFVISVINFTTDGASVALDIDTDYQITFDNKYNTHNHVLRKNELNIGNKEIRCYCNQPECVPQGYMCRGINGCFTKLPSHKVIKPIGAPSLFKPEHSVHNGCLVQQEQCPPEFLCCNEDLCNHVDSPAVISKLNKTLRIFFVGDIQQEQQLQNQSQPSTQEEVFKQKSTIHVIKSVENYWFKTAIIAICICGIVVMLILMSLAIRLLQPVFPMQTMDKRLGVHFAVESTPPLLLESPKIPLP